MIYLTNTLAGCDDSQLHEDIRVAVTEWTLRVAAKYKTHIDVDGVVGHAEFVVLLRNEQGLLLAQSAPFTLAGSWGGPKGRDV